jgi:hypothetical protein
VTYKGKFKPINPSKYKGDPTNIVYRSRWELFVMSKYDMNPDVLQWSSEEIVIPYVCPTDGKRHRYFPDFWVKQRNKDGVLEEYLIEVKPYKETIPPKVQSGTKPSRRYLTEVMTWGKNSAKWQAAEAYCMQRGWKFVKITEKELGFRF